MRCAKKWQERRVSVQTDQSDVHWGVPCIPMVASNGPAVTSPSSLFVISVFRCVLLLFERALYCSLQILPRCVRLFLRSVL